MIKHIQDELEKIVNNSVRHLNLTMAQLRTLMFLNNKSEDKISLKELEKHLEVAQSTAYGIVKRLENKGFVKTFHYNNDKRIKIVKITLDGIEVCDKAHKNFQDIENKLLSELTDIESSIFLNLLEKVYKTLK